MDLKKRREFPIYQTHSVCGGVFVFIIRALFPGASLRCWSFVTSLSRWNWAIVSQISCVLNVQQWHLIYIYIYFYYVGKICTFTLDCCSLNFLKVMQCYVYIYRTKIKVICLNMRVAMCSLSRVSNGNMIQVSRLKMTRSCKCEFYESLHSLFWFLHSWICLCECQPALKISSFTPKHH